MSVSAPSPTEHGRLRYTQRAGVTAPPIHQAWTEGESVELGTHRDYETARLHEETGVILLERDRCIITVLLAAYENIVSTE
ncbi:MULTISPECIES: hypothetical protein [Haloferax]|uniref:RelE toxin-related domain-containing protein n=1 Tax=Haloferax marinum TaxID=2666143 RepID=A0A6A8GA94_9EURY|nr:MULTISPECIES: hypothetical protein [Haloferax]KAB1197950.1 hypothetical protein Hfx1150_10640 [Haloferax sp. CBA1150]MRW97016.1 hypothetical protein [Haloferax marinum]